MQRISSEKSRRESVSRVFIRGLSSRKLVKVSSRYLSERYKANRIASLSQIAFVETFAKVSKETLRKLNDSSLRKGSPSGCECSDLWYRQESENM